MTVISRDTTATGLRMNIDAQHANAWCRIPGNLFAEGLVLLPNHPTKEPVVVAYGPLHLADVTRLTLLFGAGARPRHANTLAMTVAVFDASGAALTTAALNLRRGERGPVTLAYEPPPGGIRVRLAISFADFCDPAAYGTVRLRYALAYPTNPFVVLCNAAGTDKGTESFTGDGVPHCYALEYFRLFEASRHEAFSLLEIGLDNRHPPVDAPSLRVWREFFPNADVYGFDVNDFAFFQQARTRTFRGDQSSHDDLQRFLDESDRPKFRIIVDDGSHASSHQQISLATLFAQVEPGGVYIIEDLGWQPFPEHPTTRNVLGEFIKRGTIESPFIGSAEARYLEEAIDHVDIRRPNDSEIAFVHKKRDA